MAARHKSRQRALQLLYQWDMRKVPAEECLAAYYDSLYSEENLVRPQKDAFLETLLIGAVQNAHEIDPLISAHAEHWRIERMPAVDRNILRMAIFEMKHLGTPAAIVIDEALELARRFSTEESVHFINGVLDAVHRGAAATNPAT